MSISLCYDERAEITTRYWGVKDTFSTYSSKTTERGATDFPLDTQQAFLSVDLLSEVSIDGGRNVKLGT